jgi:catechol 2,3-dioxygenase-like lactoylglutathione lyase family enzyme
MHPQMTHICVHTENLGECVEFYRRYCRMEVIDDRSVDGAGSIYLAESGDGEKPVFQFKSGGKTRTLEKTDETHFGFAVESRERVDEIAAAARQDGVLIWDADEYMPGAYLCTLKDPNGNGVEFSYGHPVPPRRS